MKIVDRGKLAMLSITLMIIVAGYVNYKYNPEREKTLGQTVLVNSQDVKIYEEENVNKEEKYIYETKINKLDTFREERENMYLELTSNYNNVISNESSDKDQIKTYQDKLNKIAFEKNIINITENLIKSYGIKDACVIKTGDNINVILLKGNEEEITKEMIAKVTVLIKEQFKVNMSNVSITVEDEAKVDK